MSKLLEELKQRENDDQRGESSEEGDEK